MKASDYGIVQSLDWRVVRFDWYKEPENKDEWLPCPFCGQFPMVWEYNNGHLTACGCLLEEYNPYRHFAIHAESVISIYKRTGSVAEHCSGNLLRNWNHFVNTGEILFKPNGVVW